MSILLILIVVVIILIGIVLYQTRHDKTQIISGVYVLINRIYHYLVDIGEFIVIHFKEINWNVLSDNIYNSYS